MDENVYNLLKDRKFDIINLDANFHSTIEDFKNNIMMNNLKLFSKDSITDTEMAECIGDINNLLITDTHGSDLKSKTVKDYKVYGDFYLNLLALYDLNSKIKSKYRFYLGKITLAGLKIYEDLLKTRFIANHIENIFIKDTMILDKYNNVNELIEMIYVLGVDPRKYKEYIDYIDNSDLSENEKTHSKDIIQAIMLNKNDRIKYQKVIISYRLRQYLDYKTKISSKIAEIMDYMSTLLVNHEYNLFKNKNKSTFKNNAMYVGDFDFDNLILSRYSFFITDPDLEKPQFLDYKLLGNVGYKEFDDQIYKFLGNGLFTVFDYENTGNLNSCDLRHLYIFARDLFNKILALENADFINSMIDSMKDDPGYNDEIIIANTIKEFDKISALNKNDNMIENLDANMDLVNLDKVITYIDNDIDELSRNIKLSIENGVDIPISDNGNIGTKLSNSESGSNELSSNKPSNDSSNKNIGSNLSGNVGNSSTGSSNGNIGTSPSTPSTSTSTSTSNSAIISSTRNNDNYISSLLKDSKSGIKNPDKLGIALTEANIISQRLDKVSPTLGNGVLQSNKLNYEMRDNASKVNSKLVGLKNKVMWIIAGIAGAITVVNEGIMSILRAIVKLICKLLEILKKLLELLKCILAIIISGIKLLKEIVKSVLNFVFNMVNKIIDTIKHGLEKISKIADIVKKAYNFIKDLVLNGSKNALDMIKNLVMKGLDKVKSYAEAVVKIINKVIDIIGSIDISKSLSTLRKKLGSALSGGNILGRVFNAVKLAVGKLLEAFKWESITNLVKKITKLFPKIKIGKLLDILKAKVCSIKLPNLDEIAEKILNKLAKILDVDNKCSIKIPKLGIGKPSMNFNFNKLSLNGLCSDGGNIPNINAYTRNVVRNTVSINTPRIDII